LICAAGFHWTLLLVVLWDHCHKTLAMISKDLDPSLLIAGKVPFRSRK